MPWLSSIRGYFFLVIIFFLEVGILGVGRLCGQEQKDNAVKSKNSSPADQSSLEKSRQVLEEALKTLLKKQQEESSAAQDSALQGDPFTPQEKAQLEEKLVRSKLQRWVPSAPKDSSVQAVVEPLPSVPPIPIAPTPAAPGGASTFSSSGAPPSPQTDNTSGGNASNSRPLNLFSSPVGTNPPGASPADSIQKNILDSFPKTHETQQKLQAKNNEILLSRFQKEDAIKEITALLLSLSKARGDCISLGCAVKSKDTIKNNGKDGRYYLNRAPACPPGKMSLAPITFGFSCISDPSRVGEDIADLLKENEFVYSDLFCGTNRMTNEFFNVPLPCYETCKTKTLLENTLQTLRCQQKWFDNLSDMDSLRKDIATIQSERFQRTVQRLIAQKPASHGSALDPQRISNFLCFFSSSLSSDEKSQLVVHGSILPNCYLFDKTSQGTTIGGQADTAEAIEGLLNDLVSVISKLSGICMAHNANGEALYYSTPRMGSGTLKICTPYTYYPGDKSLVRLAMLLTPGLQGDLQSEVPTIQPLFTGDILNAFNLFGGPAYFNSPDGAALSKLLGIGMDADGSIVSAAGLDSAKMADTEEGEKFLALSARLTPLVALLVDIRWVLQASKAQITSWSTDPKLLPGDLGSISSLLVKMPKPDPLDQAKTAEYQKAISDESTSLLNALVSLRQGSQKDLMDPIQKLIQKVLGNVSLVDYVNQLLSSKQKVLAPWVQAYEDVLIPQITPLLKDKTQGYFPKYLTVLFHHLLRDILDLPLPTPLDSNPDYQKLLTQTPGLIPPELNYMEQIIQGVQAMQSAVGAGPPGTKNGTGFAHPSVDWNKRQGMLESNLDSLESSVLDFYKVNDALKNFACLVHKTYSFPFNTLEDILKQWHLDHITLVMEFVSVNGGAQTKKLPFFPIQLSCFSQLWSSKGLNWDQCKDFYPDLISGRHTDGTNCNLFSSSDPSCQDLAPELKGKGFLDFLSQAALQIRQEAGPNKIGLPFCSDPQATDFRACIPKRLLGSIDCSKMHGDAKDQCPAGDVLNTLTKLYHPILEELLQEKGWTYNDHFFSPSAVQACPK